jgi:diadenylate cyclase
LAETIPGVGRMGTRHRAAVGLTLQSDAIVLIVSEETGLISIAHEGRITRGLDAKMLRTALLTLTGADVPERQGIMPRPSALRAIRRRTH